MVWLLCQLRQFGLMQNFSALHCHYECVVCAFESAKSTRFLLQRHSYIILGRHFAPDRVRAIIWILIKMYCSENVTSQFERTRLHKKGCCRNLRIATEGALFIFTLALADCHRSKKLIDNQ
jgi:hypothetical protein